MRPGAPAASPLRCKVVEGMVEEGRHARASAIAIDLENVSKMSINAVDTILKNAISFSLSLLLSLIGKCKEGES